MSIPTASAPTGRLLAHQLLDGDGRVLSQQDADRPLYAASTIKLHVVLTVLQAAADGLLPLDRTVLATRTFTGADGEPFTLFGDHLDPTHPAEGVPITIGDLVVRAIDRSSNEATDHLLELVGLDAVAETVAGLGLRGTRVERLIGDGAALERGRTNETTAADLATTMRAVVTSGEQSVPGDRVGAGQDEVGAAGDEVGAGQASRRDAGGSGSGRSVVIDALRAQQIPIITAVLADGIDHGSKSGWVEGFRHDVAFAGSLQGGAGELRILAVMTAGMEESEADAQIQDLARRLLPHALVDA